MSNTEKQFDFSEIMPGQWFKTPGGLYGLHTLGGAVLVRQKDGTEWKERSSVPSESTHLFGTGPEMKAVYDSYWEYMMKQPGAMNNT